MRALLVRWVKWLGDLSTTRTQVTYAIVGVTVAVILKGLRLARTTAEIVTLLQELRPLVTIVLVFHFSHKLAERTLGDAPDANSPK